MAGFKILITDDDSEDYELIVSMFDGLGMEHDFRHLEDGEQLIDALEKAGNSEMPDLILLDINMPRMDGLEALAIIRSYINIPAIPILVYSTSVSRELREMCFKLGASGFITKFCSIEDMKAFAAGINGFLTKKCALPGSDLTIKKAGITFNQP